MEEDRIKRGSVFIAELNPTIGSEQYGRRPVVILSNDLSNKYSPTILIAPFTKILKKKSTFNVEVYFILFVILKFMLLDII